MSPDVRLQEGLKAMRNKILQRRQRSELYRQLPKLLGPGHGPRKGQIAQNGCEKTQAHNWGTTRSKRTGDSGTGETRRDPGEGSPGAPGRDQGSGSRGVPRGANRSGAAERSVSKYPKGFCREWTTRHPFEEHRLGQRKPNSNALIQRNAVVMRVAKSKWKGRLRAAGLRLASWDSQCFMMTAQRAQLKVSSHGKRPLADLRTPATRKTSLTVTGAVRHCQCCPREGASKSGAAERSVSGCPT